MKFNILNLWNHEIVCYLCGKNDGEGYSVPVDTNGSVVREDYMGEWTAVPVCKWCYDIYGMLQARHPLT
jgi:hypothetical protein